MQSKSGKTQAERLSGELLAIKPDITTADRKALENAEGYTRSTISDYLNGRGKDNDTSVKMLAFFRERIAEREKMIAQ